MPSNWSKIRDEWLDRTALRKMMLNGL